MTEIDRMVHQWYTIIYKPPLSVRVSLSVNAPILAMIKYFDRKFEPGLGNDQLYC